MWRSHVLYMNRDPIFFVMYRIAARIFTKSESLLKLKFKAFFNYPRLRHNFTEWSPKMLCRFSIYYFFKFPKTLKSVFRNQDTFPKYSEWAVTGSRISDSSSDECSTTTKDAVRVTHAALISRSKESDKFAKWQKDEDQFHLKQALLRSSIRIR